MMGILLGLIVFWNVLSGNLQKENNQEEIKTNVPGKIISETDNKRIIEEITFTSKSNSSKSNRKKSFWHETKVEVTDSYETTYVVLQYTNVNHTPREAVIYNPDFTRSYSAIDCNDGLDGEILFALKNPEKGIWTILLLEEQNIGTYRPYVMEKQEYENTRVLPEEREVPY